MYICVIAYSSGVAKLENPRLLQIHFHTLRHWKATKKYHRTYRIGPWVCAEEKTETASNLLHQCLTAIKDKETTLRLGMPVLNRNGTELMEQLGFRLISKSIRMFRGKPKHKGEILAIYGIGGPEKG